MADEQFEEVPKTEGLNQKLDYPFLLLFQMQQISKKFSEGDIYGAVFLIKILESTCPFRITDGWKAEVEKLDLEFKKQKENIESRKISMYYNIRSSAKVEEINLLTDYWIRRYDILMNIKKMQNMLYKETETGVIK